LDIVCRHPLRVIYRYANIHEKGVAFLFFLLQHAMIGIALDVAKAYNHKLI
jgi:hypothetical protein